MTVAVYPALAAMRVERGSNLHARRGRLLGDRRHPAAREPGAHRLRPRRARRRRVGALRRAEPPRRRQGHRRPRRLRRGAVLASRAREPADLPASRAHRAPRPRAPRSTPPGAPPSGGPTRRRRPRASRRAPGGASGPPARDRRRRERAADVRPTRKHAARVPAQIGRHIERRAARRGRHRRPGSPASAARREAPWRFERVPRP